jgi:hypothetical protein
MTCLSSGAFAQLPCQSHCHLCIASHQGHWHRAAAFSNTWSCTIEGSQGSGRLLACQRTTYQVAKSKCTSYLISLGYSLLLNVKLSELPRARVAVRVSNTRLPTRANFKFKSSNGLCTAKRPIRNVIQSAVNERLSNRHRTPWVLYH